MSAEWSAVSPAPRLPWEAAERTNRVGRAVDVPGDTRHKMDLDAGRARRERGRYSCCYAGVVFYEHGALLLYVMRGHTRTMFVQ